MPFQQHMPQSIDSRPLYLTYLIVLIGILFALPVVAKELSTVATIKPVLTRSHQTLSLSGSLTAAQHASLSTKVEGLVTQLHVDAGSQVKKGDVLLTLDKNIALLELAQAKAATTQAKAAFDEAQRQVKEAERLIKQRHISESELAKRRSSLRLQQAALAAAQATENTRQERLAQHTLFAPFTGVISQKSTEVGEWVSQGDTVLTLVNTDKVRLDVNVPQERFAEIQMNTPVVISPDTQKQSHFAGKISAIVPVSDPQARTFLVRVILADKANTLLPGTSATAMFDLQQAQSALLSIPRDALLLHPDGSYSVFVVRDGQAWRQTVKLKQFSDQGAVLEHGLTVDDEIVIRGNEVLQDQQAVQVVDP